MSAEEFVAAARIPGSSATLCIARVRVQCGEISFISAGFARCALGGTVISRVAISSSPDADSVFVFFFCFFFRIQQLALQGYTFIRNLALLLGGHCLVLCGLVSA